MKSSTAYLKAFGYLPDVRLRDIRRVDDKSRVVRAGASKAQLLLGHEMLGAPDGVIGPRTTAAFALPRCGHPDFPDSELAELKGNKQVRKAAKLLGLTAKAVWSLASAHASMLRNVGSGSWPLPCQKSGVKVSWNTDRAPRGLNTDALLAAMIDVYAGVGLRLVLWDGTGRANIRVSWRPLSGSTIGLAQFNNQSCNDSPFCYLDPGYYPNGTQVAELLKHEMGHNCNLQHTNGGTMSPTIRRVSSIQWTRDDPSWPTLARYFGGAPLEPETPEPPSESTKFSGDGTLHVRYQGRDLEYPFEMVFGERRS